VSIYFAFEVNGNKKKVEKFPVSEKRRLFMKKIKREFKNRPWD
jgi:hypothetical protein